ncbi:MAG: general L-amino acid transport system substrate-binding protein [Cellvibrionaceae bacterium]|jgi:general L-amino acid transport system substrate-binding protein
MKNKFILGLCLTALAVFLAACGGAADTGAADALQAEVDSLQSQLADAEAATEAAKADATAAMEASEAAPAASADTLAAVQERGVLKCGTGAGASPGFAFIQDDGSWEGFNVDYCKVFAAAVLGDASAVEEVVTTGTTRFPILQSGDADVLSNNTTWTFSRDTSLGFDFVPTVFYDGQGMMVRADSGIETLADLDGGSVCVATGTTTEKNLASVFAQLDISYEAVVFEDTGDVTRSAFAEGRCDGYTTDTSALVGSLVLFDDASAVKILPDVMSKEPLGPLVRHGDDNWFDIIKWSVNCTIQAEELGITSANVDDMLGSDDPTILSTLGASGDLGQAIGLNNDFCYQIISQVGNYGEIFTKHLGPDTPFNLSRGVNAQWVDGGLLYSPPFR